MTITHSNTNKGSERRALVPFLSIVIIILVFALGFVLGRSGFNAAWKDGEFTYSIKGQLHPEEKEINFDLFWDVWNMLDLEYVDKDIDKEAMFYGAIKGMVAGIGDPATRFFTSAETEEYNDDKAGKLEGIGVELGYLNNNVIVKRTIDGAPAAGEGLKAGDIIVEINGEDALELEISAIAQRLRGEGGTKVKVGVKRNGDVLSFDITRAEIHVKSITWEMRDDGIAVINLSRFTENTYSEFTQVWDQTVSAVSAENPKGIIVDLRNNGGGYLDGAVYVGGEFIKEGKAVLYIQEREGKHSVMKVSKEGRFLDIPLVLLVDEGTASSSEIFAGAIQHYDRAVIIGESTYGKGTAQAIREPASWGGASLHITTQKWLLPDKRWINHDDPITPDIKVGISIEQIKEGIDPQFDRAIEELKAVISNS